MINIYKTIDGKIVEIDEIEKHAWINMVNPTEEELLSISDQLNVEEDFFVPHWMKKKSHVSSLMKI